MLQPSPKGTLSFRKLTSEEAPEAMEISLNVFQECNSAEFDAAGLHTFKSFVTDKEMISRLSVYGAFINEKMVGVLATRNEGTHISLFFVDQYFQGLGIGKKLFEVFLKDSNPSDITVNSSIFAVEVYRKLGFSETEGVTTRDGLTFVPMRCTFHHE